MSRAQPVVQVSFKEVFITKFSLGRFHYSIYEVFLKISATAELEGNNLLDLCWEDPSDSVMVQTPS